MAGKPGSMYSDVGFFPQKTGRIWKRTQRNSNVTIDKDNNIEGIDSDEVRMGGREGRKGRTLIWKECPMGKDAKVEESRFLSVAFFGSSLLSNSPDLYE